MQQADKETMGMFILLICVMAGIQWLLIWLTHWSVALIVTTILSFIMIWVFVSWGHASPNGGNNGRDSSVLITPLLWAGGLLLCSLWLISYLMQKQLPNMVVLIPLLLIVTLSIGRYIYNYIKIGSYWYSNYSLCKLEIENKSDSSTTIQYIKFTSTSGYSMDVMPNTIQWPTTYIPINTDKIYFRFSSKKSNRSEVCVFTFDYALCKEKKSFQFDWVFWIIKKTISPMKLIILPDCKIDLYIDNQFIQQYQLSALVALKFVK